jgi:hypothetical protein
MSFGGDGGKGESHRGAITTPAVGQKIRCNYFCLFLRCDRFLVVPFGVFMCHLVVRGESRRGAARTKSRSGAYLWSALEYD